MTVAHTTKYNPHPAVGDLWEFDDPYFKPGEYGSMGCLILMEYRGQYYFNNIWEHHFVGYDLVNKKDEIIIFNDANISRWRKLA
jgi:hypothetical protein